MFKNVGSNWVLNVIRIAVLLHLTPFVLDALGKDVNGIWVTIIATTGLMKLLILGVPMATVRYLAEAVAKKDAPAANRALSTCLGMCLVLGLAATLVGGLLYLGFDRVLLENELFRDQSAEVLDSARLAFVVLVAQVAVGFAARLPYGMFDAHHDFVLRNLVMLGELTVRWVLTIALLSWNASLALLAMVQIGCMLAEFALALYLTRTRYPELRFSLRAFDRSLIRGVLSFSIFAMLLNLGALLAFRIDALVVGAHLGPGPVTQYDLGNKFWEPLMEFLIGIGVVLMPKATQLSAQGKHDELRGVFLLWSKIALSIVLCVALYLIVLGPEFLAWWVKDAEYETTSGPVLQLIMLSAILFLPARGVALPILMGLGKPRAPALAFLAMALLNLGLSIALVGPFGLIGVALGTAIPNVLFAGYLVALTLRELEVDLLEWASYVLGRAVLAVPLPIGVGLAFKYGIGVEGFVGLFAAGAAMVAAFGAAWLFFVFRGDRFIDPLAQLRERLHRRSRTT